MARVLIGAVLALVLASPAWAAHTLKDVRVGKHPTFTRVVFELDQPAGYRIEKKEIAAGLAELVVSLEASGTSGEVAVPKSLIESIQLQTDGHRTVAHIRLTRAGLRIKEMTLREPARIVIDVVDDRAVAAMPKTKAKPQAAQAKAETAKPKTEAAPPPKIEPKLAAVPPPRTASAPAIEPKPEPAAVPKPAPVVVKTPKPTTAPTATLVEPSSKARLVEEPAVVAKQKPGADDDAAAARSPQASDQDREELAANLPSDPTAPSADAEPKVPAVRKPPKGGMRTSLPGGASPPTAESSDGGLFTVGNAGYVLAGIALLVAVSYGVARRRGGREDFEDFDDDELDDDNPFAGLEAAQSDSETADASEQAALASDDDQTDLFAGTPAAEPTSPSTSPASEPIKTEGSDMSMDMTSDFSADADAMTTLSGGPAGGTDMEGIMRMVRELATRVGDLETRLEDAIDSKERLERQVAAQTEELRVQRAAIARTQRAVRNMSQPVEDTPTEPAPRAPRAEDQ